jgi:hypothetical protein
MLEKTTSPGSWLKVLYLAVTLAYSQLETCVVLLNAGRPIASYSTAAHQTPDQSG